MNFKKITSNQSGKWTQLAYQLHKYAIYSLFIIKLTSNIISIVTFYLKTHITNPVQKYQN